jgi:hypothetical protein
LTNILILFEVDTRQLYELARAGAKNIFVAILAKENIFLRGLKMLA